MLLLLFISSSCSDSSSEELQIEAIETWSVDTAQITGSFSPFPLGTEPKYDIVSNMSLPDTLLVGVMVFDSEIRVYPYPHTFATEIINDSYQGQKYAFSYCPITKSAVAFERNMNYQASGYLYKNNMTPWDEETETIFSQMLIRGIYGSDDGGRMNTLPVVETQWKTIKDYYPQAKVMKPITANKTSSIAGKSSSTVVSDIPELGEHTYGILDDDDKVHIFRYSNFTEIKRVDITQRSKNYIVCGDADTKIINAFEVNDFNDFVVLTDEFPLVLQDENGVKYDIFGRGDNGSKLNSPEFAYVAKWWAWDDFFDSFTFQEPND